MRFRRSTGLTESEAILAEICEASFLQLWTYPNLFKQPGKELVDLMVAFQNDVLLFSDKSCAYPTTEDDGLNWRRWFKRAISKSAHQVMQAERWLRTYPDQIFLDAKAQEPLPLSLPPVADMKVSLICVATGAAEHCRRVTGTSMLGIDLTVLDDAAPMRVGRVSEARGFLHVFDGETLALLLRELDTVGDFVAYLNAKTALVHAGRFMGAPTEADLLGYYLHNNRAFPPENEQFVLERDIWRQVEAQPEFLEGRRLNQVHRIWDRLIEYVTHEYLGERLEFGNEIDMNDYERVVRIMASESRFRRRILSQAIEERAARATNAWVPSILPSERGEVAYVLLVGPGAPQREYAEYRERRRTELSLRCRAAKAFRPEYRYLIGIGLDAPGQRGSSEDIVYMDTTAWTEEDLARADEMRLDLGYFADGAVREEGIHADEYPMLAPE